MKGKMLELKNLLKEKALEIRTTRQDYKQAQRDFEWSKSNSLLGDMEDLVHLYRSHHIAYSEMRGRTRDQIETPREGNEPDEIWIENIKAEYTEPVEEVDEEALRISA